MKEYLRQDTRYPMKDCKCDVSRLFVREALVKLSGEIRNGFVTCQCICGQVYRYDLETRRTTLITRH